MSVRVLRRPAGWYAGIELFPNAISTAWGVVKPCVRFMRRTSVRGCAVSTRADVESDLAAADIGTYVLVNGWVIIKQHQETWSWVNTRDSINTHHGDTTTQAVISVIMRHKETEQYYTVNYAQDSGEWREC